MKYKLDLTRFLSCKDDDFIELSYESSALTQVFHLKWTIPDFVDSLQKETVTWE